MNIYFFFLTDIFFPCICIVLCTSGVCVLKFGVYSLKKVTLKNCLLSIEKNNNIVIEYYSVMNILLNSKKKTEKKFL